MKHRTLRPASRLSASQVTLRSLGLALLLGLGAQAEAVRLTVNKTYSVPGALMRDAAWFADGQQAVVAADSAVLLLDRQGKTKRQWHAFGQLVSDVAVSPTGSHVAARSRHELVVWRVEDGREVRRRSLDSGTGLGFNAAGDVLFLDSNGLSSLKISTGKTAVLLDKDTAPQTMTLSMDGRRAVLVWAEAAQLVSTSAMTKPLTQRELGENESVEQVVFSPDSQTAVVQADVSFVLHETDEPMELPGDIGPSGDLALLADGSLLYADGGRAQRYDPTTGQRVGAAQQIDFIGQLVAGPGNVLLNLNDDDGITVRDTGTLRARGRSVPMSSNVTAGAFLPDGQLLAGVGTAQLLGGGAPRQLPGLPEVVRQLRLGGQQVWVGNWDTVGIIHKGRYTKLSDLQDDRGGSRIQINTAGTVAVSSSLEGLSVIRLDTGKVSKVLSAAQLKVEDIHDAIPTPDGQAVVLVPHSGDLLRYELSTGQQRVAYTLGDDEAVALAMSPGGTLMVGLSNEREDAVALVRPGSSKAFKTVKLPGYLDAMALSPDGQTLAVTLTHDREGVLLIDVVTGTIIARGPRLSLATSVVGWSASGRQVLVGAGLYGQQGSLTVFDVR